MTSSGDHSFPLYVRASFPSRSSRAVRRLCVMFDPPAPSRSTLRPSFPPNASTSVARRRHEVPQGGVGPHLLCLCGQPRRRVEVRVERHREQADARAPRRGIGLETALHGREVGVHARAVVGQRTAGVDERQQRERAAVRRQRPRRAGLVGEGDVGHGGADRQDVGRCRRRRRRLRRAGRLPVFLMPVRYESSAVSTSVALMRSPGARPSRSVGSLTLNHMVIASMKPLISSCFTWTSDLSALMASTSPVRGNCRTFAGGAGARHPADSAKTSSVSVADGRVMRPL